MASTSETSDEKFILDILDPPSHRASNYIY